MAIGTIVRFDAASGHGYIAPDDGGAEVFVNAAELGGPRDLSVGMHVRYSSIQGVRGLKAYNVGIVTGRPAQPFVEHASDRYAGIEFLSPREYAEEIAAVLASAVPDASAAQVVEVRANLVARAAHRGWLEAQW